MGRKDIPKVQPKDEGDYQSVWNSYRPPGFSPAPSSKDITEEQRIAGRKARLGKMLATPGGNGNFSIWPKMNPGGFYNNHAQRTVESLMGLNHGDSLLMFDLETSGTSNNMRQAGDNVDFFHATELGMIENRVVKDAKGHLHLEKTDNKLSMLIRPTDDVFKKMEALVGRVSTAHKAGKGINLTADERRTLSDLTLYGGDGLLSEQVVGGKKIKWLNKQVREQKPLADSLLTNPVHIRNMEKGLKVLGTATPIDDAFAAMHGFMQDAQARATKAGGKSVLGGFNIYNFDLPVLNELINQQVSLLSKTAQSTNLKERGQYTKSMLTLQRLQKNINQTGHVDVFGMVNTMSRNPHLDLGDSGRLEFFANIFGISGANSKDRIAHMALSDASDSADVFNYLSKNIGFNNVLTGEVSGHLHGSWKKGDYKVGDRFFATKGVSSYDPKGKGVHDAIYRLNKDTNTMELAYGNLKVNPLYRNTEYKVHGKYENVVNGKKQYGIMLHNIDSDLYHFIARDDVDDLRGLLQSSLVEYKPKDVVSYHTAHGLNMDDRARRRWDKMFSTSFDGGIGLFDRMTAALDAYNANVSTLDEPLSQKLFAKRPDQLNEMEKAQLQRAKNAEMEMKVRQAGGYLTKTGWQDANPEFYRDFMGLKGRLQDERQYLEEAAKKIKETLPTHQSQSLAFAKVKQLMDKNFGRNMDEFFTGLKNPHLTLNIGGREQIISLSNKEAIEDRLRSIVQSSGKNRARPAVIQERLQELIEQVHGLGGISAKEKNKLLKGVRKAIKDHGSDLIEVKQISKAISQYRKGDPTQTLLRTLSTKLHAFGGRAQYQSGSKVNSPFFNVTIESTASLTKERAGNLATHWQELKQSILDGAISHSVANTGDKWGGKGLRLPEHIKDELAAHDSAIGRILDSSRISGSRVFKPMKAEKRLHQLVNNLTVDNQVAASILFNEKNKSFHLAIFDPAYGESFRTADHNQLISDVRAGRNRNVSLVDLPSIREGGVISLGRVDRTNRAKIKADRNGNLRAVTAYDEVIDSIIRQKNHIHTMVGEGRMGELSKSLNGVATSTLQYMSMYGSRTSNQRFDHEASLSREKQWVGTGNVDMEGIAESWYYNRYGNVTEKKGKPWSFDKRVQEIHDRMARERIGFMEAMDIQEQSAFKTEAPSYTLKHGLRVDTHNVKDRQLANAVYSTNDVRQLRPFQFHDPTARENVPKSTNYHPLDQTTVSRNLAKAGVDDNKIRRLLDRGVTTDRALDVVGDQLGFLNVRAAYMDQHQIAGLLDNANATTYDGMFLIRESIAQGLTYQREGNVPISEKASLRPEIKKGLADAMGIHVDQLDLNQNIDLRNGKEDTSFSVRSLMDRNGGVGKDQGFITVSTLAKNGIDQPIDYIKSPSNNIEVTGWDAENQRLLTRDTVNFMNGDKIQTTTGQRTTAHILPDAEFDKVAPHADTIFPRAEVNEMGQLKRRQMGSEIAQHVNLALDEVRRHYDITPGKVARAQIETEFVGLLQTHFGTDKPEENAKLFKIIDGHVAVSEFWGVDPKSKAPLDNFKTSFHDIDRFVQSVDEKFGTSVQSFTGIDGGVQHGNIGLGVADIPRWPNEIGFVEGSREGLVRWGYKEGQVIERRMNALMALGKLDPDKGAAVTGWLDDHMKSISQTQNHDVDKYVSGALRSAFDQKIGTNDVVVRTSGSIVSHIENGNSMVVDPEGKRLGVMNNGVTEVTMHAFDDIPVMQYGDDFTVKDYAHTIIGVGNSKVNIVDKETGHGLRTLGEAVGENGGTFLFQLPAEGNFSQSHLRFMDMGLTSIGGADTPLIQELQKAQMRVWRSTKAYMDDQSDKTHKGVEDSISHYNERLNHVVSSAREGSLSRVTYGGHVDMSGRFTTQTINPFAKGAEKFENNTLYVGEDRLRKMISGGEHDIAQVILPSVTPQQLEKMGKHEVADMVVAEIKQNGLYSFTNRYPTIHRDTFMGMKIGIDESIVGAGSRVAKLTPGTAYKLDNDFDGDFVSSVVTHYKSTASKFADEDAKSKELAQRRQIHAGMQQVWQAGKEEIDAFDKTFIPKLKAEGMTTDEHLQNLMENRRAVVEGRASAITPGSLAQTGLLHDIETFQARAGKSDIGPADNIRYKLNNLAEATYDRLQEGERISRFEKEKGLAAIEELGRVYSQNLISSKKIDPKAIQGFVDEFKGQGIEDEGQIQNLVTERIQGHRSTIKKAFYHPSATNIDKAIEAGSALGVFDQETFDQELLQRHGVKATGVTKDGKTYTRAEDLFGYLNQMYRYQGGAQNQYGGNPFWLRNESLQIGMSNGTQELENTVNVLGGNSGPIVRTRLVNEIAHHSPEIQQTLSNQGDLHSRTVLDAFDSMNVKNSFVDLSDGRASGLADEMLSGATVAERAGAKFSDFAQQFKGGLRGGKGPNAGGGSMKMAAALFGGLWAASALTRGGPTPEQTTQHAPKEAPMPPMTNSGPTARVHANRTGENVSINISARDAAKMSHEEVSALVQGELNAMMSMQVNMNVNVQDNSQDINKQWVQQVVANAINKGIAY